MKAVVLAVTALAAVAIFTPAIPVAQAQAPEPAASGLSPMQQIAAGQPGQAVSTGVQPIPAEAPRYVWKGGYVHGKWRDGWVQVK